MLLTVALIHKNYVDGMGSCKRHHYCKLQKCGAGRISMLVQVLTLGDFLRHSPMPAILPTSRIRLGLPLTLAQFM